MKARLLVLAILLAPAAHASPPGAFTATDLHASQAVATGLLAAFETDDRQQTGQGVPVGAFTLDAARLRLEMDWSESDARVATIAVAPYDQGTVPQDFVGSSVASTHARGYSYLFLAPLPNHPPPRFTLATAAMQAAPHDDATADGFLAVTDTRSAPRANVQHATANQAATGASLQVEGSFLLVLWDLDFLLDGQPYWTGEQAEPVVAPPGASGIDRIRRQQAYLFIQDGRLDLEWTNEGLLYTHEARVDSNRVVMQGATGTLRTSEGPVALTGGEIRLDGPSRLLIDGQDGASLSLVLESSGGTAQVAGQRYAMPAPPGEGAAWWWLLLLPAFPAVFFLWPSRLRARRFAVMDQAMTSGDLAVAERHARALLGTRHAGEATLALATVLLKTGRHQDALMLLEDHEPSEERRPVWHYLLAVAFAKRKDLRRARQEVTACLAAGPAMEAEVRRNPLLQNLAWDGRDGDVA